MFCLGLYAGEGAKTTGTIGIANTNPIYLAVMVAWLRSHFDIAESRLRAKVYLHDGLDLGAAEAFWSSGARNPNEPVLEAISSRSGPHPANEQTRVRVCNFVVLLLCHADGDVRPIAPRNYIAGQPDPRAMAMSGP